MAVLEPTRKTESHAGRFGILSVHVQRAPWPTISRHTYSRLHIQVAISSSSHEQTTIKLADFCICTYMYNTRCDGLTFRMVACF